jgi:hypothetical protein
MKKAIRILVFCTLLVGSVQAVFPKQVSNLAFGGGSPVPLCDPNNMTRCYPGIFAQ